MTDRAAFIEGLRILADTLEQHEDLQLPHQGTAARITFHFLSGSNRTQRLLAAEAMFPCDFTSRIVVYGGGENDAYLDLYGELGGLKIQLAAYRKDTCVQDADGEWHIPESITSVAPEVGS